MCGLLGRRSSHLLNCAVTIAASMNNSKLTIGLIPDNYPNLTIQQSIAATKKIILKADPTHLRLLTPAPDPYRHRMCVQAFGFCKGLNNIPDGLKALFIDHLDRGILAEMPYVKS